MSLSDVVTDVESAATLELEINVADLEAAIKDLVANPAKAFADGSVQLLLKYSATFAAAIAKLPIPGVDEVATAAADGLTVAAAIEPYVASLIKSAVTLAAASRIKISPDILAFAAVANTQLDPQGDVFKETDQPPAPAPTEPAPPANEPDMPSGMRPEN